MEKPAKWEEFGLTETSWLVTKRTYKEIKRNIKGARCCFATIHVYGQNVILYYNSRWKFQNFFIIISQENGLNHPFSALTGGYGRDSESLIT